MPKWLNTPDFASRLVYPFISVTRTAHGSEAQTRTLTVYCASTFQKALTWPDILQTTSRLSLLLSIADRARLSAGIHLPRLSTIIYARSNKTALRRPLEPRQYALLYVNSSPFIASPADWTSTINQWVGYFQDPDYLRIDGQPALFVIDMYQMRQTFGSSPATAAALDQMRAAARTKGLPGVFVVGGFGVGSGTAGENGSFPDLSVARSDGYDGVTLYGYPFAPPPIDGMMPFSALADAGVWIWGQAALKSPVPFISVAMDGWDPRPWDERES